MVTTMTDQKQVPAADKELLALIEAAREIEVTEEDLMEQRISFVYGNAMDLDGITKDSVREAAQDMRLKGGRIMEDDTKEDELEVRAVLWRQGEMWYIQDVVLTGDHTVKDISKVFDLRDIVDIPGFLLSAAGLRELKDECLICPRTRDEE